MYDTPPQKRPDTPRAKKPTLSFAMPRVPAAVTRRLSGRFLKRVERFQRNFSALSREEDTGSSSFSSSTNCGRQLETDDALPPPLPCAKYSVRRRVLPKSLTALSSSEGTRLLMESLTNQSAACYLSLVEHGMNQSDPAYCGLTSLVICLNAMAIDPQVRWRGGWRYFDEDVLLSMCGCLSRERIRRVGISLGEFGQLATCHGVQIESKQPNVYTIDDFRSDLKTILCADSLCGQMVVSFDRSSLGQTGEGHFSPVGAYHTERDQVLILDVARFKYPHYWVDVKMLYKSMIPIDSATNESRGWVLMRPPPISEKYLGLEIDTEDRRPVSEVPMYDEQSPPPRDANKCRSKTAATKS